ncbi:MAG: pyridoxal phosphate-dependent aminotransferase family protein [Spirosoma sp.]|nr:pyridoxal phosphate-dependent aminotransferase family protein [Spirosoma sp.]
MNISMVNTHAENLNLRDFLPTSGQATLDERVLAFQQFLSDLDSRGHLLYRRQICSAPDREVIVNDPLTGTRGPMLMFGSNNYLGLATHPHVRERVLSAIERFGTGLGGPPLLNGYTDLHAELETALSTLKNSEDSLLFPCGFNATMGWLTALVQPNDVFFFDEYNHASLHQGMQLLKCRKIPFRHNDLNDLQRKLTGYAPPGTSSWIMVEGVYSMDGDLAPLPELASLAHTYTSRLVVDDAHGTGVLGANGSGTVAHFGIEGVYLHVGTFSKSLAATGGFISGPGDVISYLRFMSPQYMFSASLPPLLIATVLGGLEVIRNEPERRNRLHTNVAYLINRLSMFGIQVASQSGIVPVRLPGQGRARELALAIHQRGIFLNAIEYPAVAYDQERLRISVMATHTTADLDQLVQVLVDVLAL